eukprot:COSAG06_NODE_3178_length_5725_cov_14.127232_2_plen_45_part_00
MITLTCGRLLHQATLMSIISATNDLGGTAAKYLAAYMTDYFKVR